MDSAELVREIWEIFRSVKSIRGMHGAGMDIPPTQMHVLFELKKNHEGMKISDLARAMNMPDSNISMVCRRLEAGGYIEREHGRRDRRTVVVRISPHIEAHIAEAEERQRQEMRDFAQSVSEEDMRIIMDGFRAFRRAIDNYIESGKGS